MQIERIEKLRQEYTDQYVRVDADRPELARFKGAVGQVKTVNFNGRALVEFDLDNNRGRYDIELDYLKVADKPEPKPPPKKAAAAKAAAATAEPAGESRGDDLSPLEQARLAKPTPPQPAPPAAGSPRESDKLAPPSSEDQAEPGANP